MRARGFHRRVELVVLFFGLVVWRAQGNAVLSKLRATARDALELRRRRDDEISRVSSAQILTGLVLMFPPRREPVPGRVTLEVFAALSYWEQLAGRLALDVETTTVPGEGRSARAAKRFSSACVFGAAALTARRRPDLGPPLALGAAAARSITAVADAAAEEAATELAVLRATRAVVLQADAKEYAKVAREAVRKAVVADRARTRVEAPPVARVAVAIAVFLIAVKAVQKSDSGLPEPGAWAPCVTGAFEVARGGRRLLQTNEYLLRTAGLRLGAGAAVRLQRPATRLAACLVALLGHLGTVVAFLAGGVARALRLVASGLEAAQLRLFGSEYFVYDLVHRTSHGTRFGRALGRALAGLWRFKTLPKDAARAYTAVVKRLQKIIKAFLVRNHDALWPWVVSLAAYNFQIGAISFFPGIPKYLATVAALPTVHIAKYAAKLLDVATSAVRHVILRAVLSLRRSSAGGSSA